ncbi:MAG: hypothetical protein QNJ38_12695 [Prochloraceae cyanobacterium]|nr:hypothetical protein [Prochloraceae cyanobacterium]
MNINELKFLLKLFDCQNHRSYLANSRFRNFPDKDRICQQLAADGLIDFSEEIASVEIAPPGIALLNLPLDRLPIGHVEFRILDRISRYPGIQARQINIKTKEKQLSLAEIQKILLSLRDRGLIVVETALKKQKAEICLTLKGKECIEKVNKYFQSLRQLPRENTDKIVVELAARSEDVKLSDEEILDKIRDLDAKLGTDNYLPIFYLRQELQPPLSREELDRSLYNLQRHDKIELSSLQEGMRYSSEQIQAAIYQGVGRRLFFIIVN